MSKRKRETVARLDGEVRRARAWGRKCNSSFGVGLRCTLHTLDYADLIRVRRASRACRAWVDAEVAERQGQLDVAAGDEYDLMLQLKNAESVRFYGRLLGLDGWAAVRTAWGDGDGEMVRELARIGHALRPESVAAMLNAAAKARHLGADAALCRLTRTAAVAGLRLDDLFDAGENALHAAIRAVHPGAVRTLIREASMSPDRRDGEDCTPLEIAVLAGSRCSAGSRACGSVKNIVDILLDGGADPNAGQPLMLALTARPAERRDGASAHQLLARTEIGKLVAALVPHVDVGRHPGCFDAAIEACPSALGALIARGARVAPNAEIVYPWIAGQAYQHVATFERYATAIDVAHAPHEFAETLMLEAARGARYAHCEDNCRARWMSVFVDLTCRVDFGLLGRSAYALCEANPAVASYLVWHRPDVLSAIALEASRGASANPEKLAVLRALSDLDLDGAQMTRGARISLAVAFGAMGRPDVAIARLFPPEERECPHAALRYALAIGDSGRADRALVAGARPDAKDGRGNDAIAYAARWCPEALEKLPDRPIRPLLQFDLWCPAH